MPKYRTALPMAPGRLFLTDGGLETDFIFRRGVDLPHFASIALLRTPDGRRQLREYYREYARLAVEHRYGLLLDSATWRASPDWSDKLGISREELADLNRLAIALIADVRRETETSASPMILGGAVGPRADGYVPGARMTESEAADYHGFQIGILAETEADVIAAYTLNYVEEAVGIATAARTAKVPVTISFTVETDGKLPTGETLQSAVEATDRETDGYPAYYQINCAHPDHLRPAVTAGGPWLDRVRGIKANASRKSHAELNESTVLDDGDPQALGRECRSLQPLFPNLAIVGGCCGTDLRHIEQMVIAFSG